MNPRTLVKNFNLSETDFQIAGPQDCWAASCQLFSACPNLPNTMLYFSRTPWWLKKLYSSYTWEVNTDEKIIYLTFDDGPHPTITPFVLDELRKLDAKACFFCIGKNVAAYPEVYRRILDEGHAVGNHTYDHLNGWKINDADYLKNVKAAAEIIQSPLFRPPYGRIRKSQAKKIHDALKEKSAQIIMWTVLSGDFDVNLSKEKCLSGILKGIRPGSIIVFHDSEKAFPRLEYALPALLADFSAKGFRFEAISEKIVKKGKIRSKESV